MPPLFFHAGYTDVSNNCVVLRKDYEPDTALFYGPNLPLPIGRYIVEMKYETSAPDGTILGTLQTRDLFGTHYELKIRAGEPAILPFVRANNLLVRIAFVYARNADMRIKRIELSTPSN